ncbi:O-methyltransferase [Proteiniphilum sp. X52]|uniref:O-methyltransferase n=1 Tax=Proteiniphilum sp. X52 TaxID=2382159 RepID=UPI000F0A3DC1|nr:O-methyltransferase [Proteiniphilum sp. X52]RNC66879.1 O-methyltransferase [Proteiniphilum sp. X52]
MSKIEEYILSHIDAEPEVLKKIDRDAHVKLLQGNMTSGHLQGRFLKMITQMIRPKRVLEIGTFVGYSALCFAEGLAEGGELHTIEIDDELEDRIRDNFAQSEHGHKIILHLGDALDILSRFPDESFDLAFLDADKEDYALHYEGTLPKIRKGGFILVDNTLWYGKVIEEVRSNDWATQAILDFNRKLADDDRVEKVILPLRDGLTLIRKK